MVQQYKYHEYIKVRTQNIKNIIDNELSIINNNDDKEEIIEDSIFDYSRIVYEKINELYKSQNITLEPYEFEKNIYILQNDTIRQQIENLLLELNLLKGAINKTEEENEEIKLDDTLSTINNDSQRLIKDKLEKYEQEYNDKIKFLGNGGSCTAYQIKDKVIKFGNIRRYKDIPFCLNIDELIQYDEHKYMYITDKLELHEIHEEDVQTMYNKLRECGFVWTDAKKDNIGIKNNQLMILDDIDIYTEQDILKNGYYSIMKFLSKCSSECVFREIKWLQTKNPNFNIDDLDKLFDNNSEQIKEYLKAIKYNYLKREQLYYYDLNNDIPLFKELLREQINNYEIENNEINKNR